MSGIASSSRSALQACLARRAPLVVPKFRRFPNLSSRTPPIRIVKRSFASGTHDDRKGFRVSYLFGGLAGLGLLVTIYGLLEYYYSLQTWPEPIRTPLKAALKAKNRGDFDRSEVYFRKAIEAAHSLPSSALEPEPLEKLSGIYIALSAMLESQGSLVDAYSALREALDLFGTTPLVPGSSSGEWTGGRPVTQKDHIRAIGLSQKLGQLALEVSSSGSGAPPFPVSNSSPRGWTEAAEQYLEGALTAMLKLGLSPSSSAGLAGSSSGQVIAGRDVNLPESSTEEESAGRVDKRGLGMTMESLAEVYARQGKYDLAGQLLLQAVSLLLPPGAPQGAGPSLRDQCQAAMLMTTISSHALHPPSPQSIRVASSWSLKALSVAEGGLEKGDQADPACKLCGRAKAVGLYNLGMLAENSPQEAADRFSKSLVASKEYGFNEGRREASDAIRRIQSRVGSTS